MAVAWLLLGLLARLILQIKRKEPSRDDLKHYECDHEKGSSKAVDSKDRAMMSIVKKKQENRITWGITRSIKTLSFAVSKLKVKNFTLRWKLQRTMFQNGGSQARFQNGCGHTRLQNGSSIQNLLLRIRFHVFSNLGTQPHNQKTRKPGYYSNWQQTLVSSIWCSLRLMQIVRVLRLKRLTLRFQRKPGSPGSEQVLWSHDCKGKSEATQNYVITFVLLISFVTIYSKCLD